MTNGASGGTSGRTVFWRSFVVQAFAATLFMVVNSLTVLDDHSHLDPWEPWVWEGTSALVILGLLWLPWLTYRRASPEDGLRRPQFWLTHAAGVLVWSALHVAGFLVLRHIAYAAVGETYEFGPLSEEFPYELRKDALSYALFVATFWVVERLSTPAAPPQPEAGGAFDIADGQRIIRARLEDILAVTSAGNYAEFVLADGRRPLMRAPLVKLESELDAKGFVRTHRSWLVNSRRVTGLRPDGSGDWTVELGEVEAPLSRRFPEALQRLRG